MRFMHHRSRPKRFSLREKRLLCKVQNVEVLSENVINLLRETKESTPQELQTLLQQVENPEEQAAFTNALKKKFDGLDESVRTVITANLKKLDLTVLQSAVSSQLDALRSAVGATAVEAGEGSKGFFGRVGESFMKGVDYVKEHPKEAAVGALVYGTGAYLLYRGAKWFFGWGKKKVKTTTETAGAAAEQTKGGFFKKLFVGSMVGLGVFFGAKWIIDYAKEKFNLALPEALGKGLDQVTEDVNRMKNAMHPWEQYGVTEDQYKEMQKAWEENREGSIPRLRAIAGGDTPGVRKFIEERREDDETETTPAGITYAKPGRAFENYEKQCVVAVEVLEQWVRNHPVEVLGGTYLAARLGILTAILNGGRSAIEKAVEIGIALGKWGIKHPIISLFGVGSSILAARATTSALDVQLPENFQEISKAFSKGEPLIRTSMNKEGLANLESDLRRFGKEVERISDNFQSWVMDKFEDLAGIIGTDVPRMIGLQDEEKVAEKHHQALYGLSERLKTDLKASEAADSNFGPGGKVERYRAAIYAVDAFHAAYIRERTVNMSGSALPVEKFAALKAALEALEIEVDTSGNIFTYKTPTMDMPMSLCIDPAISDIDELHALSREMRIYESGITHIAVNGFLDKFRELQQENMEKFGEGWVGMVFGNFLYIFDFRDGVFDEDHLMEYIMAPISVFTDLPELFRGEFANYGVTVAESIVTTTIFSLNAAAIAKVKRLAVGGGWLTRSKTASVLLNVTPGVAQFYNLPRSVWFGLKDIDNIRRFGFFDGRLVNDVCALAGVRPEWLTVIETGNEEDLFAVARKMGVDVKKFKGKGPEQLRANLQKNIIDRFNKIDVTRLESVAGDLRHGKIIKALQNIVGGRQVSYGSELYNEIIEILTGTPSTFDSANATKQALKMIALFPDEATRVKALANILMEAPIETFLQQGADIGEICKATVQVEEEFTRRMLMRELLKAGKAEDIIKACTDAGQAYVADLQRAAETMDDLAEDVATRIARLGGGVAANVDEAARVASYADLLKSTSVDDLLRRGASASEVTKAALQLEDEAQRMASMGELLRAGHADELLRAVEGTEFVDDLKAVAESADGVADDVIARINALEPPVSRAARGAGLVDDVLPPGAAAAAGAESMTAPAPAALPNATAAAQPELRIFNPDVLDETTGVPKAWLEEGRFADDLNALRAGYADEALDAFTEATRKIVAVDGITPRAALDLLKEARIVYAVSDVGEGGVRAVEAVRIAIAANPTRPLKAAQRCIAFLAMFGPNVPEAAKSAKVLEFIARWQEADPALIEKIVQQLKSATNADTALRVSEQTASQAARALENADDMVKLLEQARFAHKFSLGRIAWTTGVPVGLEIIGLAFDIIAYNEARERIENAKKTLEAKLGTTDFTVIRQGAKTIYRHKTSGIEICLNEIFTQLEEGDDQAKLRMWTSAASLAATSLVQGIALVAPSLSLGPAGWIIAGAVITVHIGSMVAEQGEQRKLLATLPMPVLQLIGMAGAVGTGEFDVWAGASNGMISDILSSSVYNEREKRLLRKKAIALMFAQELGTLSKEQPGFYLEVLGEDDPFSFVREGGDFFSEDFEKVVGPYLSIRMFQLANDSGATWKEFRDLNIDEGWWDFTNVDIEDVRIALRESAVFYVQHLREKRYRRMNDETNQFAQQYENQYRTEGAVVTTRDGIKVSADQSEELERRIVERDDIGQKTVLGIRSEQLGYDDVNEPTKVEAMIATVYARLNANASHITSYQAIDSGQTVEQEIVMQRHEFDTSYFSAAIPEGLLPDVKSRSQELWLVPYLSIGADAEVNPEARRKAFIDRLHGIRSDIQPWHEYREGGLSDNDHRRIMDAYALFQMYPEFDPSGDIRTLLLQAGKWQRGMELKHGNIAVTLPDGALPEITRRSVPLWELLYLAAPESNETNPALRYDAFMQRAETIYDKIYKFEKRLYVMEYIHAEDYQFLLEYYALLNEYPEFDKDRAIREMLLALPQYNWVLRFPTEEHPREADLRQASRMIAGHIAEQKLFYYQYHTFDRGTRHREYVQVGSSTESPDRLGKLMKNLAASEYAYFGEPDVEPLYGQMNAREIFVVTGDPASGTERTLRAGEAPDENTATSGSYHVDGAGTFIWIARKQRHDSGRIETTYRWYYKADPNQRSFYVGHRNARGVEQPGTRFETHEQIVQHENFTSNVSYYALPRVGSLVIDVVFRDGTKASYTLHKQEDFRRFQEHFDFIGTNTIDSLGEQRLILPKRRSEIKTVTLRSAEASNTRQTVLQFTEEKPRLPYRVLQFHRESVEQLGLQEVREGVYTREGYEGTYLLQPDGSVYWTGGKTPSGRLQSPQTYFDGVWLRTEKAALNETDSRYILLPGNPFTIPRSRFGVQCFDHNRSLLFIEEVSAGEPISEKILAKFNVTETEDGQWQFTPKTTFQGSIEFTTPDHQHSVRVLYPTLTREMLKQRFDALTAAERAAATAVDQSVRPFRLYSHISPELRPYERTDADLPETFPDAGVEWKGRHFTLTVTLKDGREFAYSVRGAIDETGIPYIASTKLLAGSSGAEEAVWADERLLGTLGNLVQLRFIPDRSGDTGAYQVEGEWKLMPRHSLVESYTIGTSDAFVEAKRTSETSFERNVTKREEEQEQQTKKPTEFIEAGDIMPGDLTTLEGSMPPHQEVLVTLRDGTEKRFMLYRTAKVDPLSLSILEEGQERLLENGTTLYRFEEQDRKAAAEYAPVPTPDMDPRLLNPYTAPERVFAPADQQYLRFALSQKREGPFSERLINRFTVLDANVATVTFFDEGKVYTYRVLKKPQ